MDEKDAGSVLVFLVNSSVRDGWTEKVRYGRIPVVGDLVQVPSKGTHKKVLSVTLLPYVAGEYQAAVIVS